MSFGKTITLIGFSLLFLYILMQILNFYGISQDSYGIYIGFFLFILLSMAILPNQDMTLKYTAN
jgi:hypothetical protein